MKLSFSRLLKKERIGDSFDLNILPKIANSTGLQVADLIARPIGRHILNPDPKNRAFSIIKNKLHKKHGKIKGYGLKIFP